MTNIASPFVESIIDLLTWVNLAAGLVLTLMMFVRRGFLGRIASKLISNIRYGIVLMILWPIVFMSPVLIVPVDYQVELLIEILKNFALAAFPLGPTSYVVMAWKIGRMDSSEVQSSESE